jgi:hypothetical protein
MTGGPWAGLAGHPRGILLMPDLMIGQEFRRGTRTVPGMSGRVPLLGLAVVGCVNLIWPHLLL